MAVVIKYLWITVLALSVAALALGIVFIVQSYNVKGEITDTLRQEEVTLGIDENAASHGDVVDSANEVEAAAETIREHRQGIAPTYGDLLAGGRYDPTNPTHLRYAQGVNLENALNLARVSYGVSDLALGSGVFMIVTGIALAGTGLALRKRV